MDLLQMMGNTSFIGMEKIEDIQYLRFHIFETSSIYKSFIRNS